MGRNGAALCASTHTLWYSCASFPHRIANRKQSTRDSLRIFVQPDCDQPHTPSAKKRLGAVFVLCLFQKTSLILSYSLRVIGLCNRLFYYCMHIFERHDCLDSFPLFLLISMYHAQNRTTTTAII